MAATPRLRVQIWGVELPSILLRRKDKHSIFTLVVMRCKLEKMCAEILFLPLQEKRCILILMLSDIVTFYKAALIWNYFQYKFSIKTEMLLFYTTVPNQYFSNEEMKQKPLEPHFLSFFNKAFRWWPQIERRGPALNETPNGCLSCQSLSVWRGFRSMTLSKWLTQHIYDGNCIRTVKMPVYISAWSADCFLNFQH